MGLFGKRSGVYVIVCHLDGYRCYVDEINFHDGKVYFTQDVTRVGHFFSKEDNSVFDVYNVFAGEVISVEGSSESLEGFTITIKHENDIISVYSSLSNVSVKIGDILDENVKIGVSGTTIKDTDAGIHVHLEILQGQTYINPKNAIGKETSELASAVK